jgi:hypothetical protein
MTTNLSIGSRFARKGEPSFRTSPWQEALETQHGDDAHAVCYASDRRLGRGDENGLACHVVFLDYDESNDHPAILERLLEIPETSPSGQWAAVYPTKGGMRVFYVLSAAIPAEQFGLLVRGLAMDLWRT